MTTPSLAKSTLLMCYDHHIPRQIFREFCDKLQRDCITVEKYSEAIDKAKSSHYDGFFLDFGINAEPVDVRDIASRIKNLQPGAKIIGLSMSAMVLKIPKDYPEFDDLAYTRSYFTEANDSDRFEQLLLRNNL